MAQGAAAKAVPVQARRARQNLGVLPRERAVLLPTGFDGLHDRYETERGDSTVDFGRRHRALRNLNYEITPSRRRRKAEDRKERADD